MRYTLKMFLDGKTPFAHQFNVETLTDSNYSRKTGPSYEHDKDAAAAARYWASDGFDKATLAMVGVHMGRHYGAEWLRRFLTELDLIKFA